MWLSEEWFSPDGIPGIAIPFFVAHPRLLRQLERRMMGDVDGGSSLWRLRLLRHEAGHVLDTAYRLRKRTDWRRIFGPSPRRGYPGTYTPRPRAAAGTCCISGIGMRKAIRPRTSPKRSRCGCSRRRAGDRDYAEWPGAIEKLEFVNALMDEIAGSAPHVARSRLDRTVIRERQDARRTLSSRANEPVTII